MNNKGLRTAAIAVTLSSIALSTFAVTKVEKAPLFLVVKGTGHTLEKSDKKSFASGCTITLYASPPSPQLAGTILIKNNADFTVNNIQASGLPAGVTQDSSNCVTVAPQANCTLQLYPGDIVNSSTATISGSNTISYQITVQVVSAP